MGQIKVQTIKGATYSYIGVLLGFAISGLLLPKLLSPGENGLLKLLIAYSSLFTQFATLGFSTATGRLFSHFRDEKSNHRGFIGLTLMVLMLGFVLAMLTFFLLKENIIAEEKSDLFANYILFLIPLIFFTLLYYMLDVYFKMLFKTVIGTFVKEFLLRILILISILLFFLNIIDINGFIIAYVIANCMPGLILLVALFVNGKVNLKPDWKFIDKKLARSLASMSFYGIVLGFSGVMVINIDSIMISRMVNIDATGIYAITYFFGTLVVIPSRSLRKIAGTVLAEAWHKNNPEVIAAVYRKSSINQLIIGTLIFVGLWGNIDNVFQILPPEYVPGMYVIFFIGLTGLIEMTSGVGELMIQTSRDYRIGAWMNILFLFFVVIFNYIFIHAFGLVGAAMANALAFATNSSIRYIFIYKRYGMHPFSIAHVYTLLIGITVFGLSKLLPTFSSFLFDIAVRSTLIASVFLLLAYYFQLSPDINESIQQGYQMLFGRKKK